jgi:hypothetical protein
VPPAGASAGVYFGLSQSLLKKSSDKHRDNIKAYNQYGNITVEPLPSVDIFHVDMSVFGRNLHIFILVSSQKKRAVVSFFLSLASWPELLCSFLTYLHCTTQMTPFQHETAPKDEDSRGHGSQHLVSQKAATVSLGVNLMSP